MPAQSQPQKGFTLVELLVVMSIIALLLTIGLSFYGNAQRATRDAKRRSDLDAFRKSLETYKTEKETYVPATTFPCTTATSNWTFNSTNVGVQGSFTGCPASIGNALRSYFVNGAIPEDPLCSTTDNTCSGTQPNYHLSIMADGSFTLYANLENPPSTTLTCAIVGYNYCVRSQQQ